MSDWETSRQQWLSWIEGDSELHPPRKRSFDAFDDDLRQLLEQSPFLGRIVPEPAATEIEEFDEDDVTAVRSVSPAVETRGELRTRDDGVQQASSLDVGMQSADGSLEVDLQAPSAANGAAEEVEGLFIPQLTRQSTGPAATTASPPAATEAAPASAVAQVSGSVASSPPPPHADSQAARAAQVAQADRSAASSQTAGEIVSGGDPAAASMTHGEVPPPEPAAPRKGHKIVVSPSVAQVTPPLFDDDDTDELDTTDLVETDLVEEEMPHAEVGAAEVGAAEVEAAEVEAAEVEDAEVEDAEVEEAEAEPIEGPTPPPAPPPKAKAKGSGEVPPAPRKDKVVPLRDSTPEDVSAETRAALAQLQATVRGPELPKDATLPKAAPGGWFEEAFGAHYAALLGAEHAARAEAEVEFILGSTKFKAGARVLDVGCGTGEHAIALAQRGFSVTGLDASAPLLERAIKSSQSAMAGVQFVHGDMRELSSPEPYDLVVCLGTTLGYFDDETNRKCIARLAAAVTPGGRLVLHVFNRDQIIGRLPARSWWQTEGCLVLDEANMNYFTNRLHVHRTVAFDDGRQIEHDIHVRGYSAHELGKACVDAGLRVLEISGSIHTRTRFYGSTSPEIWLVLERPTD